MRPVVALLLLALLALAAGASAAGDLSSGADASAPTGAVPETRFPLLSRALLPAKALGDWRGGADTDPAAFAGLSRLTAADQQEEAESIAVVLRDALETPGARAALVTPDRQLANRVAAALLRYGVVADDSAGEALVDSPPAVFLRLTIRAVAEGLAPVPLLALLKHPLTGAGLSVAACRDGARALELACLRGPRPGAGIAGIRIALDKSNAPPSVHAFWTLAEKCLEPVFRILSAKILDPAEALAAVIEAAERLAATDTETGPARLWSGEEGEALATRLSEVLAALPGMPDQRRATMPGLLDAVLQGGVVRDRRALRGRGGALHPRVFIWGLLEARLQSVDTIVLGGLAETVWPPATDPGPWLSRPMRTQVGLPSPEEIVGQAAHDFLAVACSAPTVVLSCPTRRDGAPTVPARWLVRLEMFLAGQNLSLPVHPAAAWVRSLDLPAGGPKPAQPPTPRPDVGLRPRRLSVTEIETWVRDPYAIYARHILKLRKLDPLDQATDASDYGSLVHKGLAAFLERFGNRWPPDAPLQLAIAMERALRDAQVRPALQAWWRPRLQRIAAWVAETEAGRRANAPPDAIEPEADGTLLIDGPFRTFTLVGRADRIDRRADGTLSILDYKTGTPPSQAGVESGLYPQLPLEAAMASRGAFPKVPPGPTGELIYWHLSGGATAGKATLLFKGDATTTTAAAEVELDRLRARIAAYENTSRPYLSHPNPSAMPRFADYAQLARVKEWLTAGEDDE